MIVINWTLTPLNVYVLICVIHTRGKIGMNQTVGKHCEIGTFCMQNIVNIVKWGYFVCDTIEQGFKHETDILFFLTFGNFLKLNVDFIIISVNCFERTLTQWKEGLKKKLTKGFQFWQEHCMTNILKRIHFNKKLAPLGL